MRAFERFDPIVTVVYYLSVMAVAMFCMEPILIGTSLAAALIFSFMRPDTRRAKGQGAYYVLFLVTSLANPLVSHNGGTVLFLINDTPITLESALWGLVAGAALLAVLYWFNTFSSIMTSDKLLYVLGKLTPRGALIFTMSLRYVPLFRQRAAEIKEAQRAAGLYKDGNVIDRVRGGARVFSILVTWSLENGAVTADSMAARGYGTGRRTSFSPFRFGRRDAALLALILLLFTLTLAGIVTGGVGFEFYPYLRWTRTGEGVGLTPLSYISYLSYGILAALPIIIESEDEIRWKYLRSRI